MFMAGWHKRRVKVGHEPVDLARNVVRQVKRQDPMSLINDPHHDSRSGECRSRGGPLNTLRCFDAQMARASSHHRRIGRVKIQKGPNRDGVSGQSAQLASRAPRKLSDYPFQCSGTGHKGHLQKPRPRHVDVSALRRRREVSGRFDTQRRTSAAGSFAEAVTTSAAGRFPITNTCYLFVESSSFSRHAPSRSTTMVTGLRRT